MYGDSPRLYALMRATGGRMSMTTHTLPVLFTLAFAGRFEAVRTLLETKLAVLNIEAKTYWAAIADLAAGNVTGKGQVALEQLAKSSELQRVRVSAQRALIRPLEENARHMSAASRATVAALEQRVPLEPRDAQAAGSGATSVPQVTRARPRDSGALLRQPVTWFFVALCCAAYGVQIYSGNAQSIESLIRLGGLVPDYVVKRGEWWRLVTSTLLHGDPIHLLANMLALWSLGSEYEASEGSWRMLVTYVLSGIGASLGVLWLMWVGITPVAVLVGASGAIYGLFGAVTASALIGYLRTRDPNEFARLVNILVVLAINLVGDQLRDVMNPRLKR